MPKLVPSTTACSRDGHSGAAARGDTGEAQGNQVDDTQEAQRGHHTGDRGSTGLVRLRETWASRRPRPGSLLGFLQERESRAK